MGFLRIDGVLIGGEGEENSILVGIKNLGKSLPEDFIVCV